MAKQKLPTEDKRSEKIALRLTPSEATQLKEHAADAGFPQVSDYLRALIGAGNQALEFK